jgi:hypothetical protein
MRRQSILLNRRCNLLGDDNECRVMCQLHWREYDEESAIADKDDYALTELVNM